MSESMHMSRCLPSVDIPDFDPSLEKYLMHFEEPIWVYDPFGIKNVWCNIVAVEAWGKKSFQDFIDTDLSEQSESARNGGQRTALNLLHKQFTVRPWTFYPTGKEPLSLRVRFSVVYANENLCLLAQGLPASGVDKEEILVHDSYKFNASMLSIWNMDEKLLYQNIKAEQYYGQLKGDDRKSALEIALSGLDCTGTAYRAMIEKVKSGDTYRERIQVPPHHVTPRRWHDFTISKRLHAGSGEEILDVMQVDATDNELLRMHIEALEHSKKEAQKDRLAQAVGHELKTPLHGIIGLSDELLNHQNLLQLIRNNEKHNASIANVLPILKCIKQSGLKLSRVVNNIIDVSQLKWKPKPIKWLEYDPNTIITEIVQELSEQFPTRTINTKSTVVLPTMIGDEKQIIKIFRAILTNAMQYSSKGDVKLHSIDGVADNTGCIVFSISDQGIGIAPQHIEQIFDLFEQADTSATRKYQGAGIGLSLAKSIVEIHGGSIFAKSELSKGTTISFSLPYRPDMLNFVDSDLESEDSDDSDIEPLAPNKVIISVKSREILTG